MAITVVNIRDDGHLEFEDHDGIIVGFGRAYASKHTPGYVTLTLSNQVAQRLGKGEPLRVPINWLTVTTTNGAEDTDD